MSTPGDNQAAADDQGQPRPGAESPAPVAPDAVVPAPGAPDAIMPSPAASTDRAVDDLAARSVSDHGLAPISAADAAAVAASVAGGPAPGAVEPGDAPPAPDDAEYFWPPPPKHDRWKHRRGEPRLFAFLWMVWLIFACVVSLGPLGPLGLLETDATRPACRRLAVFLAVGVAVVWPLVRLSQAMPRRPGRAVWQDVLVVITPIHAILWPLFLITSWSWADMLTAALVLTSWAVLVAGVLRHALASLGEREVVGVGAEARPGPTLHGVRAFWTAGFVALAGLAPLAGLALGQWTPERAEEPAWAMASPITGVLEALKDRPLEGPRGEWANVGWRTPAVIGGLGLLLGLAGEVRGGNRRSGLH